MKEEQLQKTESEEDKDEVSPLRGVAPEVVFFGEPRLPPPAAAARDTINHGTLLGWARHGHVAPRNSAERLTRVFPRGQAHPEAARYRLTSQQLTYEAIRARFEEVMWDLEAAKAFLEANVDLVPPKLFLRTLTAEKLSHQSRGDLEKMRHLLQIRDRCILAHDQLFFPLIIETKKAESRVMTYLNRPELATAAQGWDTVELSLLFTTFLAARNTWDEAVQNVVKNIEKETKETVEYLRESVRRELTFTRLRSPAVTAQIYRNASLLIQQTMPDAYAKLRPEIQLLHEVSFLPQNVDEEEQRKAVVRDYITSVFCPRQQLTLEEVKQSLRIYSATLGSMQGTDYSELHAITDELYYDLCSDEEAEETDRWYADYIERTDYGFETYEPDTVPSLVQLELRTQETSSSVQNFAKDLGVAVPTTPAFAGLRPKSSEVGDWLSNDPAWDEFPYRNIVEVAEDFRAAYIKQVEARKEEQLKSGIVWREFAGLKKQEEGIRSASVSALDYNIDYIRSTNVLEEEKEDEEQQ